MPVTPARVEHPFLPVYDQNSRILILGSFPSVRSRETGFYYGHPQNRFWPLLARLAHEDVPADIPARKAFVLRHGIALWDSVASCELIGSSDASIRQVTPNDFRFLLASAPIEKIYCNGRRAYDLYERFGRPQTGIASILLPSTSAANAAWGLDRLTEVWQELLDVPGIFDKAGLGC